MFKFISTLINTLRNKRGTKFLKNSSNNNRTNLALTTFYLISIGVNQINSVNLSEKCEAKKLQEIQNKIFLTAVNIFKRLGEFGVPVEMPDNLSPEIQKVVDEGWGNHAFNMYLSDLISVQRKLPDYRSEYCKTLSFTQLLGYRTNLPSTSVIIILHNEG